MINHCPICKGVIKNRFKTLTCFDCDLDFDKNGYLINHDDYYEDYCKECGGRLIAKEALKVGSRHYGYCESCVKYLFDEEL